MSRIGCTLEWLDDLVEFKLLDIEFDVKDVFSKLVTDEEAMIEFSTLTLLTSSCLNIEVIVCDGVAMSFGAEEVEIF